jgi:hypothetical protein
MERAEEQLSLFALVRLALVLDSGRLTIRARPQSRREAAYYLLRSVR